MKIQNKKGFTLIELLVVITIIGILATGAVTSYTSYIQKSRDTNRMNEMMAIKSAVEQSYGDDNTYPKTAYTGSIGAYLPKIPKDIKDGKPSSGGSTLGYWYASGKDDNGVEQQRYEISAGFESSGNVTSKAADTKDNGGEGANGDSPCNASGSGSNVRFEIGIPGNNGKLDLSSCSGGLITNVN